MSRKTEHAKGAKETEIIDADKIVERHLIEIINKSKSTNQALTKILHEISKTAGEKKSQ